MTKICSGHYKRIEKRSLHSAPRGKPRTPIPGGTRGFNRGFQSFYTVLFVKVCGGFDYI